MPVQLFSSLFALVALVCTAPVRALRPSRPCQVARLEAAVAQARRYTPPPRVPTPLSPVHRPRHARPRPYTAPLAVPDYARFCEAAVRHRALWRLTYEPADRAPYQAHHRAEEDTTLAATDIEALDFALSEFTPPGHARSYLRPPAIGPKAAPDRATAVTGAAPAVPALPTGRPRPPGDLLAPAPALPAGPAARPGGAR
ncbi:hypothetical protein [Nocardiopsis baichengensis]|uniref:hypothetical protein n=1 Tax=Nocardiopsis baichengensis TaxID=280240 RepID=UPI000348C66D|nr:hypothetical protein [Nocardiopsis baichengensis]